MCGIVGLYVKNPKLKTKLGKIFRPMLIEMTNRGPDSTGVAIYRNPAKKNEIKFTLAHNDASYDWKKIDVGLEKALRCECKISKIGNHCILVTTGKEKAVTDWLRKNHPEVRVVGSGHTLEIFKETGLPAEVYDKFNLDEAQGTHIIGLFNPQQMAAALLGQLVFQCPLFVVLPVQRPLVEVFVVVPHVWVIGQIQIVAMRPQPRRIGDFFAMKVNKRVVGHLFEHRATTKQTASRHKSGLCTALGSGL